MWYQHQNRIKQLRLDQFLYILCFVCVICTPILCLELTWPWVHLEAPLCSRGCSPTGKHAKSRPCSKETKTIAGSCWGGGVIWIIESMIQIIPGRYPFPKAQLKMCFLFQRWHILLPWRVDHFRNMLDIFYQFFVMPMFFPHCDWMLMICVTEIMRNLRHVRLSYSWMRLYRPPAKNGICRNVADIGFSLVKRCWFRIFQEAGKILKIPV